MVRAMMVMVMMIRPSPPIYVQPMPIQLPNTTLEGHHVTSIKLLLLNKTAPTFGHHIALAAVPIGVPEPPQLSIPVLKIQQQTLLIG